MTNSESWATRATAACEQFQKLFPGRVTVPEDANYDSVICQSWSVTSRIPATAYVDLRSTEDVVKALSVIRHTGSRFAIRSAGHNANPGFSSVGLDKAGVVLDLSGLKSQSLDKSNSTARFGGGNNWLEVSSWMEAQGLSVVGSREGQVGLSGFLLGGVITGVSLETHELIKAQYTINMYDVSDYHNVLAAFVEVQEAMEVDHKIGMFINTRKDYTAVGLFYADWSDELPRVFDPFSKLTSLIAAVVPTTNGTLVKLMDLLEQWAYREKDLKHAYLTMTSRISQELYEENFEYCKDILAKLPATVSLHWSIQPLSQAAVEAGEKRGGNILGLQKVPQSRRFHFPPSALTRACAMLGPNLTIVPQFGSSPAIGKRT
ncbi:FAD-binding domain-containing protein [Apiospora marii]|uniref:FAD-binding domain-containing protein n=1 Tax=Apiospora marii TaxID=335849 RepID=UPI0031306729